MDDILVDVWRLAIVISSLMYLRTRMDSLCVMKGDARLLLRFGGAMSLRIWLPVRSLFTVPVSSLTRDNMCVCRRQPRVDPTRVAWDQGQHGVSTRRLSYLIQLCARHRGARRA